MTIRNMRQNVVKIAYLFDYLILKNRKTSSAVEPQMRKGFERAKSNFLKKADRTDIVEIFIRGLFI